MEETEVLVNGVARCCPDENRRPLENVKTRCPSGADGHTTTENEKISRWFYHCWLAWVRVFGTGETQRWKYPCMTLGDRVERHGLWIGATKSSLHGGEQRLRWSIAGQVQGGLWERQVPLPPPYFFLNTRHTVNRQSNGSHSCFVGVCGGNGLVGRQLACVVLWLGSRQT